MATRQTALRAVPHPAATQETLASSIRALAAIADMDQASLAVGAEMDPTALSKALKGKRKISVDEMARLASALNVQIPVLFEGGATIRRKAMAGVLAADDERGPDVPPGLEVSDRAWNGDVLDFRARRTTTPAVAQFPHRIAS